MKKGQKKLSASASAGVYSYVKTRTQIDEWMCGNPAPEMAAEIQQEVEAGGPTRALYREMLGIFVDKEKSFFVLDWRRTTKVAATEEEWEHASLVMDMPLPHRGRQARIEGRLCANGIRWRLLDASEAWETTTPYTASEVVFPDPLFGSLKMGLSPQVSDPLMEADAACFALTRMASGKEHPRIKSIAMLAAESLRSGSLLAAMREGARVFDEGVLDTREIENWVALAISTRIALNDLAYRLDDAELDAALEAADTALEHFKHATLLLDEEWYTNLTECSCVDPLAWWGYPELLDDVVPTALVCAALEEIAGRN